MSFKNDLLIYIIWNYEWQCATCMPPSIWGRGNEIESSIFFLSVPGPSLKIHVLEKSGISRIS